ncbi:MAG: hypothetical protein K8J08_02560 [Thermoanaerobaculia bacterium]|nr:hypothetical protein [Thermoanaerobaculia bacterium]
MLAPFAALVALVALVAVAGLAGVCYRLFARAGAARHALALDLHEKALRIDQRCDYQQREIDRLARRQRIAYLSQLVEFGAHRGDLPERTLPDLRQSVMDLYEESFESDLTEMSELSQGGLRG